MKNNNNILYIYLSIIIIFSLLFFKASGTGDVATFLSWGESSKYGLMNGYEIIKNDYPPISYIILSFLYKIAHIINVDYFLIFKASLYLSLILSSIAFYIFSRDVINSLILYATLTLCSVGLGYIDIYCAPLLIISLFFLKANKIIPFSIFFSIACFIKYQPLVISPFLLIYVYKKLSKQKFFIHFILPVFAVIIIHIVLFRMALVNSLLKAMNHPFLSGAALNFCWIIQYLSCLICNKLNNGMTKLINTDTYFILKFPKLFFIIAYTLIFYIYLKQEKSLKNLLIYSFVGFMSYFMLNIGVHENHLFVSVLLSALLLALFHQYKHIFIITALMFNINLLLFEGIYGESIFNRVLWNVDLSAFFAIINVLFFAYLFYVTVFKQLFSQRRYVSDKI
jgi:hypothetical protein